MKAIPIREIGGHRVRFSLHALERALDMAVDDAEIRAAITDPQHVAQSRKVPRTWYRRSGRVTLVTTCDDDGVMHVITVLWATTELWQADFDRTPTIARAGRERGELAGAS